MDNQANTKRLLSIGEASEHLGVSIDTLRRWEKRGRINPLRSPGGHRYFDKVELDNLFGKRYTRDEETERRTNEELGRPQTVVEPVPVIPTPQPEIPEIKTVPQMENTQTIPPIPGYSVPETPLNSFQGLNNTPDTFAQIPASDIKSQTSEPSAKIEPTQPQLVQNTSQNEEFKLSNILLPNKNEDNTLSQEEIERRVNTIIAKDDKKNGLNITLVAASIIALAADIFLLYLWFTTSRISSPIP